MTGLAELVLRTSYHKGRDDIANDFYLPAMRRATKYDRAVGYFRSAAFIIAWPALREFVAQGGRIPDPLLAGALGRGHRGARCRV